MKGQFPRGSRVRFSKLAVSMNLHKYVNGALRPELATVFGYSKDGKQIYVCFDGQNTLRNYAVEFFELATQQIEDSMEKGEP